MAGLAERLGRLFTSRETNQASALQDERSQTMGADGTHTASTHPEPGVRPLPRGPIEDVLAQKLLLGWTANRTQTLHPLTMNLSRLDAPAAALVLQTVAMAILAAGPGSRPRAGRAAAWIRRVYGTAEHQAHLDDALQSPPLPHVLLEQIKAADLTGHAYAATLGATDQRNPVSRRFADYLAARLGIQADVGRSLGRRYRN